jgi:EcsC protein family
MMSTMDPMSTMSGLEFVELREAARKLETQSLAMKVADRIGVPVETLLHMLPKSAQKSVGAAVQKALERCLQVALRIGPKRDPKAGALSRPLRPPVQHRRMHVAAAAVSGAVGGFFGLPGMLVELPITTTLMLHSIVEIARAHGEDLNDPANALACLEVFALGPGGKVHAEALESAYYVSRAALAQATREATSFLVQKGAAKEGAPALVSFLSRVAARFGMEVSEKVAAEMIPIAGALGGLTLNVLFSRHFQAVAEGHFTVRRLERKYGVEEVRLQYERARRLVLA